MGPFMHAFMPTLGPRTLNFEAYCSTILRQIGKTTTARVPDSETVFRTFRAQEVEDNCVHPASKVELNSLNSLKDQISILAISSKP